ncbi:hypothetical protein [Elizabethkingia anophelis]|uniref:hypothetical protein n=1 Tax=Elizabethkingia anophelis TaxID=1117645 RepID=UPI0021A3A600|nr:hypothetical protein [Elizabethkingia anophelis]MCT4046476.1 hypothetical protein [Elizabethkingia anophelis]CAH1141686.1 hypothetical protein EAVVTKC53_00779 [Elizabethkingia anophelis]CAI9684990.1 hypothetical protein EAVVTKC53_02883 [Elizabethkingia anophelis]
MKYILTDSCYWIGLLDSRDQYHDSAKIYAELTVNHTIIVPFPCLYETISTYLIRKNLLSEFQRILSMGNIQLIHDEKYRDMALKKVFNNQSIIGYTHSLVDAVLREILSDDNLSIDYLLSFNKSDFIDICSIRNIVIYD